MSEQTELGINENLAREEFRPRSLAEGIKDVLRKHEASLAEWNHNQYIVPPGFQVYS